MKTKTAPSNNNRHLQIVLGLAAAALIAGVFTGLSLTLGISDRTALIALLVIGFAMCGLGMRLETYGWLNPFNLAGILIGTAGLLMIAAVLFNIQLPFISSDRDAIFALSIMMAGKVFIAAVRDLLAKPAKVLDGTTAK